MYQQVDTNQSVTDKPEQENKKHKVFVYGSLMNGGGNHPRLASADFLGKFKTKGIFQMISLGAFPAVWQGVGKHSLLPIRGELYEVGERTLNSLDSLESNGRFYQRELIDLEGFDEKAWMYILMNQNEAYVKDRPIAPRDENAYDWSVVIQRQKALNEKQEYQSASSKKQEATG